MAYHTDPGVRWTVRVLSLRPQSSPAPSGHYKVSRKAHQLSVSAHLLYKIGRRAWLGMYLVRSAGAFVSVKPVKPYVIREALALPFSTSTDAKISSGSPILPKAGTFRLSGSSLINSGLILANTKVKHR